MNIQKSPQPETGKDKPRCAPSGLLDLTGNTTILHVQPVLSIQKLRNIANTLAKTTPSNHPHSCQELEILLSKDLTQKEQCTKAGRKRARQSQAVSWAILCYVPNADKHYQSPVEISPQMKSVLASIRRIQSRKERSYSIGELLLGLPQRAEPRREASHRLDPKHRHSYKRVVRSNVQSSGTRDKKP
jgi:hypothetical protein